jgi:hypothetical protein
MLLKSIGIKEIISNCTSSTPKHKYAMIFLPFTWSYFTLLCSTEISIIFEILQKNSQECGNHYRQAIQACSAIILIVFFTQRQNRLDFPTSSFNYVLQYPFIITSLFSFGSINHLFGN